VSFRPIVAPTDELAWEKAHTVLARVQEGVASSDGLCCGMPLTKELQGRGSTTALVGSYETVAQALLDYTEIGCDLLSVCGWDNFNDAIDLGRYVLPLVRGELAHRAATGSAPVLNPESTPEAVLS
jgi:alkanesulfonate monooxygenase